MGKLTWTSNQGFQTLLLIAINLQRIELPLDQDSHPNTFIIRPKGAFFVFTMKSSVTTTVVIKIYLLLLLDQYPTQRLDSTKIHP